MPPDGDGALLNASGDMPAGVPLDQSVGDLEKASRDQLRGGLWARARPLNPRSGQGPGDCLRVIGRSSLRPKGRETEGGTPGHLKGQTQGSSREAEARPVQRAAGRPQGPEDSTLTQGGGEGGLHPGQRASSSAGPRGSHGPLF